MKLNLRFNTVLLLMMTAFSGFAQQKNAKLDSIPASPFAFPNSFETDTTAVPLVDESLAFYNYNYLNKKRLDSIRNVIPMDYNEYVQSSGGVFNFDDVAVTKVEKVVKWIIVCAEKFFVVEEEMCRDR